MLAAATHSITAGASGEDAAGPPPLPAALPSSAAAALGTSMSPRLPPARCFKLPIPEGLALPGVEVANRGSRSPAALSRRLAGLPPPVIRWLPADTGRLDRPRGLGRPTGDSWARMRPTARPTGALIQLLASTTAVIRRARGKYRRDQMASALKSSRSTIALPAQKGEFQCCCVYCCFLGLGTHDGVSRNMARPFLLLEPGPCECRMHGHYY